MTPAPSLAATLVLLPALAACSRRAPLASCRDDLRGVYAAGDERWMVLDDGATLDAYPLFPDLGTAAPVTLDAASAAERLEISPRMLALARPADRASGTLDPSGAPVITGTLRRRYMRRAERCDARVPVHVTRCAGDTLELVLADPAPPLGFAPCTWPGPAPSRVVRWRRE